MNKIYFDENRGHVCAECAEDLALENLPEASDNDAKCVICTFTEKRLGGLSPSVLAHFNINPMSEPYEPDEDEDED